MDTSREYDHLVDSFPTQLVNNDVQFAICEDVSMVFSSFLHKKVQD